MSTALREAHVVLVRGSEGRLHFQSCLNLGTRDGISPSRVPFNSLTAHGPTSAYLFPYNSSYGPGMIWMPFTGARKCVVVVSKAGSYTRWLDLRTMSLGLIQIFLGRIVFLDAICSRRSAADRLPVSKAP